MVLTTKQKKLVRTTIFLGILLISGFSAISNSKLGIESVSEQKNHIKNTPSSSAFWKNTSIIIDATATINTTHSGNWTWAAAQDWCKGLGTWDQPYRIENMTFEADYNMNGLLIANSNEFYFEINNCTFLNATTSSQFAGLNLNNAANGTITECNMSTSYYGLLLDGGCDNITITYNNATENNRGGIRLGQNAINNTIAFNNASDNDGPGIWLYRADYNHIYNNTVNNNIIDGSQGAIYIYSADGNLVFNNTAFDNSNAQIGLRDAENNRIYENKIGGGNYGIYTVSFSHNTSVINNSIYNSNTGININGGHKNNILDNDINNGNIGIYFSSSDNNTVQDNRVIDNIQYGIQLYSSDNSNFIENTISNSGSSSSFRIIGSNNLTLFDNIIDDKGLFLDQSYHNQINQGNTVSGKPIYYYEDQDDLDLNGDIITNIGQLFLINCNRAQISNFNIRDVSVGIYIDTGNQLSISNNNVSNNYNFGLNLKNTNQSSITGNIASNNLYTGMNLLNIDHCSITSNTVNDNNRGIYCENDDPDDWDEEDPDLSLLIGENTFSENNANNNKQHGMETRYSKFDTISNNICFNNTQDGIYLEYVYNSTISNNQVINSSQDGIGCYYSQNNNIFENEVINTTNAGIYLEYANHTKIVYNIIELNGEGISLYDTHHVSIENNEITSNVRNGIDFEIANDTKITGNIISLNSQTGILIDTDSYENIIFRNIFIQNTVHAEDNGFSNQWYNQNIGNYWDNYTGSDLDDDGIGDTSHSILGSANNFDLYPIFGITLPLFIETPINASFTVNQTQILNWTVQDYIIWGSTYTIFVNGTEVGSGTWESDAQFSFDLQSLNLEAGVYNVTVVVSDGMENSAENSILVIINPEIGGEPQKISGWLIFLFIVLGLSVISVSSMLVLKKTKPEKYDLVMEKLKGFFSNLKNIGKSDT
ncbi:NosD domain-containing protein [Promethearchaeum syntrophicum]|uniref:NosD domain-containing protein n=1 Tax=Promethearchaeum syntrophicum TaxID=2594042 RepID=A0A5B9DBT8_9ARCH|nr:NosD domain-containing protein [Candidatus Prometheoarchaeum syntrophicum]QEE16739.1 hypothetical protein DSAG12_02569 [Candidatus Prometheoarchaeum syntrophicum]